VRCEDTEGSDGNRGRGSAYDASREVARSRELKAGTAAVRSLAGRRRRLKERHTVGVNTRHHPRRHGEALAKARASFISIFCIWIFCVGTDAPAVDIAASQIGRRRHRDLTRLGIPRGLYSLSVSTARFLSHVTTIANHDFSLLSPNGTSFAHCGRSSQRPIKGAAVSIFVSANRSERSTRRPSELSSG